MSHGPMPAAVYWRRRLAIVAVILALAWLALRYVGGDDSASEPSVTAAPPPQPAAVVPADGTFEVALAAPVSDCDPQQVRITPAIPPEQAAGGAVTINLVITSADPAPCTLQPDDAEVIAVISASGATVWDSTLCTTSLLTEPVQLAGGGWGTTVGTTWSGRRSGKSCAASEDFATPGQYTVQLGTLGGEPGESGFTLTVRS